MIVPIEKILCPTDFSEPSYEGLKAVNELADYFSAELVLVHVITTAHITSVSAAEFIPQLIKELEESAKQSFQQVMREHVSQNMKVGRLIIHGGAAEEIVQAAEKQAVDLIVIATHGQSGWRKFLFGSFAERVVRFTECPVLTIRAPVAEDE